ncbi:MAG: hypothetical protein C0412_13515 [Flavobacterium sp.]|nr:hypothetical protein [Flavobacterium sp.]
MVRRIKDGVIISGGARGADTLAVKAAIECGLPFREYPAEWDKYGKKAGVLRNSLMLEVEKPDLVVAFCDDIQKTKGTKDTVTKAMARGIRVMVI